MHLKTPPFFPSNHLAHQLVFCEHGESVDTVIVDGKPVVESGRMTTIDEPKILQELMEQEETIKEKIRQAAARGPELEPCLRQAYFQCVQQGL